MPATIKLTADQTLFRSVMRKLKTEADGQIFRAELRAEIKGILAPAIDEVRQGVLDWPVEGLPRGGPSLRQVIAAGVKVGINSSGRLTGARVYVSKKGMPRGFSNAPRDVNRPGWRHGTVDQVGVPGFFDKPLRAKVAKYRAAIVAATERMAKRVGA